MAQYYANIQGNRSTATRMGTKKSGISGHIRGWDIGAKIYMHWNAEKQKDEVRVYLTAGSNGNGKEIFLGCFDDSDVKGRKA